VPLSGMTLVEVLVAMVILLVGIWAVASGFPKLFGVLAGEEKRTEMSRLAEGTVERLKTDPYALPLAISGGPTIHPDSVPDDPDIATDPPNSPNSRDDILWVGGESFVVPAVDPTTTVAVHVFNLGLAQGWAAGDPPLTAVYEVWPLTAGTHFTLDTSTGVLGLLGPFSGHYAEVSYAWRDTGGGVHYVHGEVVGDGDPVAAASATGFHSIVADSAHGRGRRYYTVICAVTDPPGTFPGAGEAVQNLYGAALLFNSVDVGKRIRIDYYLRTDPTRGNRRALIMSEDRQISSTPATINLVGTGIDGTPPSPIPGGTNMLAVDLNNGAAYGEGTGLVINDYGRGTVTLHAQDYEVGHTFRFYYRTTDQYTITVQKAPSLFVPIVMWDAYDATGQVGLIDYRVYDRFEFDSNGQTWTCLDFTTEWDGGGNPVNSAVAGQTVAVDYTYGGGQLAVGEMHTISASVVAVGSESGYLITLDNPGVENIVAVRGMSLKVRAWWRTQSGRLVHQDVDTILGLRPM